MNKVVAGRGNLELLKDAESSSNSEMLKMSIFTSMKKINFLLVLIGFEEWERMTTL